MVSLTDGVRTRIIGLVKNGMPTKAIGKVLHGKYSRQQIAAVRAWVTMGSYGGGTNGALRATEANKVRNALFGIRNRVDRLLKTMA